MNNETQTAAVQEDVEEVISEEEVSEDVSEDEAVTEAPAQEQADSERDYENEALEMGWVPQDEFKGDPKRWTDAKTFVEKGENFIPFLRADNKKLKAELDAKDSEIEKRVQRMERMYEKSRAALEEQHKIELSRIKSKMKDAVEVGDVDTWQRLDAEKDQLQKSFDDRDDTDNVQEDPEAIQNAWIAQNTWYQTDFKKAQEAKAYSEHLAQFNPKMTMKDNLAAVTEYMQTEYPELSGKKPAKPKEKKVSSAVDGGPEFGASPFGKKEKGFNDLPPEAKQQCALDVADNLFNSKAEWAKEYFSNG